MTEITGNGNLNGGVSTLFVGDLMQLQPVFASFVFSKPSNEQYINAYNLGSIFDSFTMMPLITNFRQKEDLSYAAFLERLRFGNQTPEDIEMLQTRTIDDISKAPENSIFLAGKNKVSMFSYTTLTWMSK